MISKIYAITEFPSKSCHLKENKCSGRLSELKFPSEGKEHLEIKALEDGYEKYNPVKLFGKQVASLRHGELSLAFLRRSFSLPECRFLSPSQTFSG
jgi:hypothetical protein